MKGLYFLVVVIFVMSSILLKSQTILEYERTTFTGTYQQITGTQGPWGDDDAQNYYLPFPFHYIDQDYNQIRICTNGWIELGSDSRPLSYSFSLFNEDLFSSYEPNKTIAPWWDDISALNYPVEYTTLGSEPNRVFVVQWREVNSPLYSGRYINFQVRLYETSNIIEFWYGSVSGNGDIEYASFGVKDHIGGSGHFIDGPTGSNTIGTINLNSYDNWPSVFYRFSPAPIIVMRPNGGEFFSIGYVDTIKWSSTVNNVNLEYSTDSGNNWNTIENSVPASTGLYTWLVPNTPSENSLVRISDDSDPTVFDISDNVFTISEPPSISVFPDSIYFVLNEGDSTESLLNISNSGQGNLYYEISIENISDRYRKDLKASNPNPSSNWRDNFLKAKEKRGKFSGRNTIRNDLPRETLPLVISDPIGDGGAVDIVQIRGRSTSDSIKLQLVFETDLNAYDFGGYLGLDIDQNVLTGLPLPDGLPGQEVGCEYYISLYYVEYNEIDVYDQYFNFMGYFPCEYDTHNLRFSFPLSILNNDDGLMNLAAVVGNGYGPTDWIPDEGYGILGGNLWLNVNPLSGTITPGNSEDVLVKIKTDFIDGGEYYANILISSNDPVNQIVTVPVHITVVSQPNLIAPDSIDFDQVYIGYPLSRILDLENTGSVNLEVSNIESSNSVFTVQGNTSFNIEPLGIYHMPVLFNPTAPGIETGTLSVISNDPSSPYIINLSGEGIYPPDITVSPDSFFYDLNVGDSIATQFIIDNSNGLGELNFQISDKLIAGKSGKKTHQELPKHKKVSMAENPLFGISLKNLLMKKNVDNIVTKSHNSVKENPRISLPLIVQDIIGDGGNGDISEIRGRIFNDNLEIEYVFADGIIMTDSLIAELYLDVDRNPFTGYTDPYYFHDLGVDYYVMYYPFYLGNEILVWEVNSGNMVYTGYADINGTTISYSIPLSVLANDDGEMDLLAVSGVESGPLDWAPDEGHATLYEDVPWLNENPISGTIPPGGSQTIELNANTSELIGGNFVAGIDIQSNDPSNPILEIPFRLHLTGIPQMSVTPDSLNFGATYIGYSNSLSISVASTGTDSLIGNITSTAPEFIVMDSVFALPVGYVKNIEVKYQPVDTGFTSASITINSNAGEWIVYLSGTGLIPPNIITSTDTLEFSVNSGETLHTGFQIYNNGGSDLTVDISDKIFYGEDQRLFATGNNMIYEINPDNGTVINSFPSPIYTGNYYTALAFSGDHLFFTNSDYSSNIFVLDPENGNVISAFPSNSNYCSGLAYIDPYLYTLDSYNNLIYVLDPTNGNVINTLIPSIYLYGDIDGGNGRLFGSDGYEIFELNIQNGLPINSFYTNNQVYGIGFTGGRLFTCAYWAGIDEYNPDTGQFIRTLTTTNGYTGLAGGENRDAAWINENPNHVTIAAGDSTDIALDIIAPDSGNYSASMVLESNDPDASILTLPIVLHVVTGVNNVNTIPTVYSLYYNYPNPFNPATTIKYDLPRQCYVNLTIYNVLGEEVAILVNSEQAAGRYKVLWNANQFASGIYIYRIQASDFVDVKKMMLVK